MEWDKLKMDLHYYDEMLGISRDDQPPEGGVKAEDCRFFLFAKWKNKEARAQFEIAYSRLMNGEPEDYKHLMEQETAFLKAKVVFTFAAYWTGKESIAQFCAAYKVLGSYEEDGQARVRLEEFTSPAELENRLWIKWDGKSSFAEWEKVSRFKVIEVEPKRMATVFRSYEDVYLSYEELKTVLKDDEWIERLKHFGGVYLINDTATGMNYVGSAGGESGIYGRWSEYADNPAGGNTDSGNKRLVALLYNGAYRKDEDKALDAIQYATRYFRYSILDLLPVGKYNNQKAILAAEQRWKRHLGTMKFGYNAN